MDISCTDNYHVLKKCTEILPFTIYVFDFNSNKFIYTNRNFEDIIGYPIVEAEKALNFHTPELFHPDDVKMLVQTFQAIKSGKRKEVEVTYRVRQVSGEYRWIRSRKIIFEKNPDGTTRQFLGISEDITARKKIENELIQAKQSLEAALTAKERFFSVISHEIRTPLNAIIGMIQLLQQSPVADNQTEIVDTLKYSSDNLLALINDVLDFSKIQAGKLKFEEIDFDIKNTLEHTRRLYDNKARDKGIKLRLHIEDDVPQYIKGDPTRLSQILNNLVSNALKFTDQGRVTLSLELHSQTKRSIILIFKVADTGIGIPPDKLKTIFEPFEQSNKDISRRFGGTGLGLSIIKNLVDLQKGKIKVQSKVNEGSTFEVKLKFRKTEKIIAKSSPTLSRSALNMHVLYIEDVVPNQFLMRGYCSYWNIDVAVASTGEEGIQKVQSQEYDLVLMDIQLPGIDGYEVTRRIRNLPGEYFSQVPILAVSASTTSTGSAKFRKAGMNDYILKPINPEKMYRKLAKFARKKTQAMMQRSSTFSELDHIYREDPREYQSLLKVMKKQFETDKTVLLKAVMEKNDAAVSQIRHRSLAIMATLQQHDFIHFLENLKGLSDKKDAEIQHTIVHVNYQFDEILTLIKQKSQTLRPKKASV